MIFPVVELASPSVHAVKVCCYRCRQYFRPSSVPVLQSEAVSRSLSGRLVVINGLAKGGDVRQRIHVLVNFLGHVLHVA